ncbi:MAG: HD domain-containing phosphohydrolase [Candidatus Omnitrophota bacterium]
MPSQESKRQFMPISVSLVASGKAPPLDLYYQRDGEQEPILFRSRTLPLRPKEIKELTDREIKDLWILEEHSSSEVEDLIEEEAQVMEKASAEAAADEEVAQLIQDPSVPTEEKCEVVYNYSTDLMKQVFESPNPEDAIKAASVVLPNVTEVIFGDKRAAHEFILRASVDYAIYSHAVNTCLFGVALARRALKISKQDALLRFGPGLLLHDIGKLRIPKEILEKTEPLDEEERSVIEQHTLWGVEMVKEFMDLSPECESIILHHHERMDGSGYPHGLRGEQISVGARICAIVDVFDAISTRRSFQDRKTSYESFKTMLGDKAKGFDRKLLEEFLYIFVPPEEG